MKVEGQAVKQDVFPLSTRDISSKVKEKKQETLSESVLAVQNETSREEIVEAVKFANEAIKISMHHLEFVFEDDNPDYQVKVVDSKNGKIIREIPPDYIMKIRENIKNSIEDDLGIILDEIV